ncbi:NlpC/P60 family protein [Marinactinospora rubrisoli]|uniref:NlpC/P60 family protein n=1 Tax=Marinactinospora rubrisoli TaxID=2715399 RepID=A0ABW2KPI8_9ACTN
MSVTGRGSGRGGVWRRLRARLRRPMGRGDLGRAGTAVGLSASLFMGSTLMVISGDQIFEYLGFGSGGGSSCTITLGDSPRGYDPMSIPEDLLPIYQAAGEKYDIPWSVLAAIGRQETEHARLPAMITPDWPSGLAYGTRNPYGAAGPMQFGVVDPETRQPGGPLGSAGNTWGGLPDEPAADRTTAPGTAGANFGVDGNGDGRVNVWDPHDAIFSTAVFLRHFVDNGQSLRWAVGRYHGSGINGPYVAEVFPNAERYENGDYEVAPPVGSQQCDTTAAAADGPAGVAIEFARSKIGLPYIWGGVGPAGYDCSGLLMMAYREAGINIPRTTQMMQAWDGGEVVPFSEIQPGDLILEGHGGVASHVAMWTGDNRIIEAYATGTQITEHAYDDPNWPRPPLIKVLRVSHLAPSGSGSGSTQV